MKYIFRICALMQLCCPLVASAFSNGPIDGYVMNDTTHKPVAGAIIVALWLGREFNEDVCYHVETAVSDAQGRYRINKWSRSILDRLFSANLFVDLEAYQPGFVFVPPRGHNGVRNRDQDTGWIILAPFEGIHEERMKYLERISTETCSGAGESTKNLLSIKQAAYVEAQTLASADKKDQDLLRYMRRSIRSTIKAGDSPVTIDDFRDN